MKKVLIIAPSSLPIPAIKGGAVETGINQLLDENEHQENTIIDVISYYNEDAYKMSKKYDYSNFYYYKPTKLDSLILTIIKGINKFFRIIGVKKAYNIRPFFTRYICKNIKLDKYDAILIKNAVNYIIPFSKYTSDNLYLQLHNDFLNINTPNASKIVEKCRLIVTNSKYIKEQVLTIQNLKSTRVKVNMNCLDNYSFSKADTKKRQEIMEKYNLTKEDKIILFSGRMVKEKGIRELLYAVKKISKTNNWKLLIAGAKWFSENKKDNFIKELESISSDMKDRIVFLGYISHSDISFFNSIADVVVIPSIWDEPAGRVALEAAAVGTPVIVSDAGGLKEYIVPELSKVVKRGPNFVDDLAKAIEKVITNENKLSLEDTERLIDFAKQFNSKRYYNEIMKFMSILED